MTILDIKLEKIADPEKRVNIAREFDLLSEVRRAEVTPTPYLLEREQALRDVNRQLWDVEDALRACEARQCFDADFIALARSVYRLNDQRSTLKREINLHTGSVIIEEKSYHGGPSS